MAQQTEGRNRSAQVSTSGKLQRYSKFRDLEEKVSVRGQMCPTAGPPHLESKAVGWRRYVSLCLFQLVAQGEAVICYCCRGAAEKSYNHTSGLGFLLKCIKR